MARVAPDGLKQTLDGGARPLDDLNKTVGGEHQGAGDAHARIVAPRRRQNVAQRLVDIVIRSHDAAGAVVYKAMKSFGHDDL